MYDYLKSQRQKRMSSSMLAMLRPFGARFSCPKEIAETQVLGRERVFVVRWTETGPEGSARCREAVSTLSAR